MTGASSSVGDARLAGEDAAADWLLRRVAGAPGLFDPAVVQAVVAARMEWLDRLFPVLRRVLARAIAEEADGVAQSPSLTLFISRLRELMVSQPAAVVAGQTGEFPAPPPAAHAISGFAEPVASPGLAHGTGETPPRRHPSADAASPLVTVRRVSRAGGGNVPDAVATGPGPVARGPVASGQDHAGTQPLVSHGDGIFRARRGPPIVAAAGISSVATSSALRPGFASALRPQQAIAVTGEATLPRRSDMSATARNGATGGAGSPALFANPVPSVHELPHPLRARAFVAAAGISSVATSSALRPGFASALRPQQAIAVTGEATLPRRSDMSATARNGATGGAGSPALFANPVPSVHELPHPLRARAFVAAAGPSFPREAVSVTAATAVNATAPTRPHAVAELPVRTSQRASMMLPSPRREASQVVGRSPPNAPPNPAMPRRPNLPVPIAPGQTLPPATAFAGLELDRLAERVSRVIARRIAVERERRGR